MNRPRRRRRSRSGSRWHGDTPAIAPSESRPARCRGGRGLDVWWWRARRPPARCSHRATCRRSSGSSRSGWRSHPAPAVRPRHHSGPRRTVPSLAHSGCCRKMALTCSIASELDIERNLAPEGAVVVEDSDASAGSRKSGLPSVVVLVTKSISAERTALSFQSESGSPIATGTQQGWLVRWQPAWKGQRAGGDAGALRRRLREIRCWSTPPTSRLRYAHKTTMAGQHTRAHVSALG